jgi:MFS family permease
VWFAVVLRALVLFLCGGLGDLNGLRKPLFVGSLSFGAFGLALFVIVDPSFYWFSGLLLVLVSVAASLATTFFNAHLVLLARDRADVRAVADSFERSAKLVDRTMLMSVGGIVSSFCGAILLTLIVLAVTLAFREPCSQWCIDCPTLTFNRDLPTWAAYEYDIANTSCGFGAYCSAWPGINPPCDLDMIRERECFQDLSNYEYSERGARWSLNISLDPEAAFQSANRHWSD